MYNIFCLDLLILYIPSYQHLQHITMVYQYNIFKILQALFATACCLSPSRFLLSIKILITKLKIVRKGD